MILFLITFCTCLSFTIALLLIALRGFKRRYRRTYKALMIAIIQCNDYAALCAIELQVDRFYEEAYGHAECHSPEEVAKWAVNLYNAINERTEEFTGLHAFDCPQDIGQLLKAD